MIANLTFIIDLVILLVMLMALACIVSAIVAFKKFMANPSSLFSGMMSRK